MNLTDKKLARLLPAFPERAEVRDPAFKGLVYRGSRRSAQIVLRRTVGGTRQRITLGEWPAIPLDTARAQAAQVLSVWTSEGAAAATRTTRTTTLSDVIGAWEEAHIENRRTNERARDIRKIFSGLLEQDVFALDTPHYLMTADEYRSRAPIHTRSVIRDLRSVLAWGAERDLCPEGCLQAVKLPKPEARDHTPTLEEMGIAWRALGRLDSDAVPILRLIMLTAFRNGEARAAEWRWLNSKTGVLTIPS